VSNPFDRVIRSLRNLNSVESIKDSVDLKKVTEYNVGTLELGIDANGEQVRPSYATNEYLQFKQSLDNYQGGGNPDLKVKGTFHNSINSKLVADGIEIDATDSKAPKLLAKYKDVLGLNDEAREILKRNILPLIQKDIREQISQTS
jgi:hypothetical protein